MLPDRQWVNQYDPAVLGLVIYVRGEIGDPDSQQVTVTMTNQDTNTTLFTGRTTTRVDVGTYEVQLTSQDTEDTGSYQLQWAYALSGVSETYLTYVEVGEFAPDYAALAPAMKVLAETTWNRFEDLFDSPLGGPNLQVYFQSHFNRNRLAQLLRIAVGLLNTTAQPFQTYTLDGDGGASFPIDQWGALLEKALYCVDPSTPVLREDLQWVPAGEIRTGDKLVAFDEEIVGGKFRTATVLAAKERISSRLRVTTSFGDILVTPDHRFVVRRHQGTANGRPVYRRAWAEARSLQPGIDEIVSVGAPWSPPGTYEAGYLSGLIDGEGCLTFTAQSNGAKSMMSRLFFSQKPGSVMDKAKEIAKSLGFEMAESVGVNANILHVRGGFTEQLRFLGMLRPLRLLEHPQFNQLWESRAMRQVTLPSAHVLSVASTLDGPVSVIQTSTGTLLTGGLLSHNCETLKHLVRSYVEQPALQGGEVTRHDRRDYLDRWRSVLQDEREELKTQLDVFKIRSMGLGRPAVLVSGGAYGRAPSGMRYLGLRGRPRYYLGGY